MSDLRLLALLLALLLPLAGCAPTMDDYRLVTAQGNPGRVVEADGSLAPPTACQPVPSPGPTNR